MTTGATEQYQLSPVTRKRIRPRSIFAAIVFTLATILTPAAVLGHWAHTTVLDAERYIETVGPIGTSPEVQEVFAEAVTNAILEQVDTEQLISDLLGGILPGGSVIGDAIAAPLATGVNNLIGDAVARVVASDVFETAWLTLNTAAQRGLVAVLEGNQSGPVQVDGENLVLNLDPLIESAKNELVAQGLTFAANITLPETNQQIVLATVPALAQAQTIYSFTAPILNWIVVFIAALFLIAVFLARRRAWTGVAVGIAIIGSSIFLYSATVLGEGIVTNQFTGTIFESASLVVYQNFLAYLVSGLWALLVLGIAIIVGSWLAGHTTSAEKIRGHFTAGLQEIAARTGLNTGSTLAPYAPIIRWVLLGVWLIYLLSGTRLTGFSGVLFTALILGIWTVLEILIHARTTMPAEPSLPPRENADLDQV